MTIKERSCDFILGSRDLIYHVTFTIHSFSSLCYFHVSSETIGLLFHTTSSLGNPPVAPFKKQLHYTRCSNDSVYMCVSLSFFIYYNMVFKSLLFLSFINNVSINYDLQKEPHLMCHVRSFILWNIQPICLLYMVLYVLCLCYCRVVVCIGCLFGKAENSDG